MLFDCLELPAKIVEPLKDQTTIEKQTITFTCKLSKPNKKVTWYKDGEELTPANERYSFEIENCSYTMTLKDTVLDDEAKYSMKIGDEETTCVLRVDGKIYNFKFNFILICLCFCKYCFT